MCVRFKTTKLVAFPTLKFSSNWRSTSRFRLIISSASPTTPRRRVATPHPSGIRRTTRSPTAVTDCPMVFHPELRISSIRIGDEIRRQFLAWNSKEIFVFNELLSILSKVTSIFGFPSSHVRIPNATPDAEHELSTPQN